MKKRMLLGISILVLANMAVANPSQRVGHNVRNELTDVKIAMLDKNFKANVPAKLTDPAIDSIKTEFDALTEDLYNKYRDFTITGEDEADKTAYETPLKALNDKITEELNKEGLKEEDRTKLHEFKAKLDEHTSYAEKLTNYRSDRKKLSDNQVTYDDSVHNKFANNVIPNSYVSEYILDRDEDKRTELYRTDNIETFKTELLTAYNDAKTKLDTATTAYNRTKEDFEKATEDQKDAKNQELETKKKELETASVEFNNAKRDINSVLSIAGTNVDAYTMLVTKLENAKEEKTKLEKDPEKANEVTAKNNEIKALETAKAKEDGRISKELSEWQRERKEFRALANQYVGNGGTNERVLENAINIEENRKAIEKNREDIQKLRKDFNSGMAQNAALAAVDFGTVRTKTVKVGAGLGYHRGASAVALGVAAAPSDKLMLNVKWSTGKKLQHSTLGVGAVYEFEF